MVLSLGIVAVPMAGRAEANPDTTYYIKTDGDNSKDGLSWETAWKTITHAAATAPADSTIIVADGTYDTTLGEVFPITINKSLTLLWSGIADTAIIDGSGTA